MSDFQDSFQEAQKFVRKHPRELDPLLERFFNGAYYDRILVADISSGAFRTWHCIRRHVGKDGTCFPGQRLLHKMMNCSPNSIQGWIAELVKNKWLAVREIDRPIRDEDGKKKNRGVRHVYTLLDGQGEPLRKTVSPKQSKTVTKNRNTKTDTKNSNGTVTKKHSIRKAPYNKGAIEGPLCGDGGLDTGSTSSESAALRPSRFADAAGGGTATADENSPENLEALWK